MNVGFHTNQIGERGTEVAIYDYALANINKFGNKSIIFSPYNAVKNIKVLEKFQSKFIVYLYENIEDFYERTRELKIDLCYYIKSGENDGLLSPYCKNVVHAVFNRSEPHGDRYAYISRWLSIKASKDEKNYVPHIISIKNYNKSIRNKYDPDVSKKIFGCYGGKDSFNIWYAVAIVILLANLNNKFLFFFMNTRLKPKPRFLKFLLKRALRRKTIILFKTEVGDEAKSRFINACDVMLHARKAGESFGIAIGEFSIHGKPIITCNNVLIKDRCHLEILKNQGNYYCGPLTFLMKIFKVKSKYKVSNVYQLEYNVDTVMERFQRIFLS
jgi:hypothetical protein